jgi:hypothetical protein
MLIHRCVLDGGTSQGCRKSWNKNEGVLLGRYSDCQEKVSHQPEKK